MKTSITTLVKNHVWLFILLDSDFTKQAFCQHVVEYVCSSFPEEPYNFYPALEADTPTMLVVSDINSDFTPSNSKNIDIPV